MTYDAQKYLHVYSGLNFFIDRNMIVGTREEVEEGMQLIGDESIEKLIDKGILIKVNPTLSVTQSKPPTIKVENPQTAVPIKVEYSQPVKPTVPVALVAPMAQLAAVLPSAPVVLSSTAKTAPAAPAAPKQSVKQEPKILQNPETFLDLTKLPPHTKVKIINKTDYQSGNFGNAQTVSKRSLSTLRNIRIKNFGSRKLVSENEEDKSNYKRVKLEDDRTT